MTYEEAEEMMKLISAVDQRRVTPELVRSWWMLMEEIPFDADTEKAITEFFSTPRERYMITPQHIREGRIRIRNERLDNFQYVPVEGDEDPQVYKRELLAQRSAVADGKREAAPALPAARPRSGLATVLEALGRDVNEVRPMSVPCPSDLCGARVGQPCKGPNGKLPPGRTHGARRRAVRT